MKALLKNKQLHPEVFAAVDDAILIETNRAMAEEAELDTRIDNATSHVDQDGILESLVEVRNAIKDNDNNFKAAYEDLGVEANLTFSELIARLTRLENKRLTRISYEAHAPTQGNQGGSGIPDGAGEPFDQTVNPGPALALRLDSHFAAFGITYDSESVNAQDWTIDPSQVAIRVILNGEDLVEASQGDLEDGDFFLVQPPGETDVIIVRHMHADDTLIVEIALKRIGEGTPDPDFDLGGDLPYSDFGTGVAEEV